MGIHVHYSHASDSYNPGFDVDLGSVLQVGLGEGGAMRASDAFPGLVTAASVGDVSTSSIVLDDPNGTLGYQGDAIGGLHRMYFVEDSCPAGDHVIWNGYVGAREYSRGADSGGITPTGVGRRVLVELQDDNAILGFRLATSSDANRAAETASARLTWLLGTLYLGGVKDDGLVDYPSTAMDACDYRGQYGRDILADIALQTNHDFWSQYNQSTGHVQLWFNSASASNSWASSLQISNVSADIDNVTTFAPYTAPGPETKLRRDPSRVYAGVYLPYSGGSVYVTSLATASNFALRDGVAPNNNIKTLAKAAAAASNFLADARTENDLITTTIRLPASQLTAVKAGQLMNVKFSHLPGYAAYTPVRVVRKTMSRPQPTDSFYDVGLELSPISTVGGLHQVVLLAENQPFAAYADPLGGAGPYQLYWGGSGAALSLPPVGQDTDGYATHITDGTCVYGYYVGQIVIPAGLGGTYQVYVEHGNWALPWFSPLTGVIQPVPYVPCGAYAFNGSDVYSTPGTATFDVLVNGTPALSATVIHDPSISWNFETDFTISDQIRVRDGDVVKMQVTGTGTNVFDGGSYANCLRSHAAKASVLALTRTGD